MPWLYEHVKENKDDVELHIHTEDNMIIPWTYRHLMNMTIANCGRPVTESMLRRELKNQLNMSIEDMMEGFELCKDAMLREINGGWIND